MGERVPFNSVFGWEPQTTGNSWDFPTSTCGSHQHVSKIPIPGPWWEVPQWILDGVFSYNLPKKNIIHVHIYIYNVHIYIYFSIYFTPWIFSRWFVSGGSLEFPTNQTRNPEAGVVSSHQGTVSCCARRFQRFRPWIFSSWKGDVESEAFQKNYTPWN